MSAAVAVVGSANLDIVVSAPRRPVAGETLLGSGHTVTQGGKGANQAIAAARVAETAFVGTVGTDSAATTIVSALRDQGVDVSEIEHAAGPTGQAFITVTPDGENSIIVLPLANAEMRAAQVMESLDRINPLVVLTQFEVRSDASDAVIDWCRRTQTRLILNPSPVRAIDVARLSVADPLIVNGGEALAILEQLRGESPSGVEATPGALAEELSGWAASVVLTAGSNGAFVAVGGDATHVVGHRVEVVDTTGAGDAFAGTLAGHLAHGVGLVDAAARANQESARLVQLPRTERQ